MPKLIILPGLDGSGGMHTDITAALSIQGDVQTVAYPPDVVSYADVQDFLARILPSAPYILIAESFSGPAAVTWAKSRPTGLQGVIFVASFARAPRRIPLVLTHLLRLLPLSSSPFIWGAQPAVLGRWSTKILRKALQAALKDLSGSVLAGRLRAVLKVDVEADIAKIEVPCLYVRAKSDRLVPQRAAHAFSPKAKVVTMDGPHFLLQANPQDAAQAIQQWIAAL